MKTLKKLTPVLKLAENLIYDGFTLSKVKKDTIYNVASGETREVPPDVLETMSFLEGFVTRMFDKITKN